MKTGFLRKLSACSRSLVLAVLSIVLVASLASAEQITILHFNDFHASVLPYKINKSATNEAAGLARMVALLKAERTENTLTLFAGDMLLGTEFSTVFKGDVEFRIFEDLVDFMTIGNHEFDYGLEALESLRDDNRIPMLNANVRYKKNGKLFADKGWAIKKINGIKVGIFGLLGENTPNDTNPKNVETLEFASEAATARKAIAEMKKEGAQVIIALTHIGVDRDKMLADAAPGIDLIVGAHSHSKLAEGIRIGTTLIVQAEWGGINLGKVVLDYDKNAGRLVSAKASLIVSSANLPEDGEAKAKIEKFRKKLDGKLNEVIGETKVLLNGERADVRSRETNLGNFIADSLRATASADMALMNGGGIRASIPAGEIRIRDIQKVLPFNNTLQIIELPGAALLRVLERAARDTAGGGSFLQVSKGLQLVIKDKQLVEAKFNGQPLDAGKIYKVATIDFLIVGGGGFVEFKEGSNVRLVGGLLSEVLIETVRKLETIDPKTENRISVTP